VEAVALGTRLRDVRRRLGLSLHEVQARSELEFKASVLGAYERGERAISAARLVRLAEVYGIPPAELLPPTFAGVDIDLTREERAGAAGTGWTLDLTRLAALAELRDPTLEVVARFANAIARARSTVDEGAITLRDDDVWAISTALGTDRGTLHVLLETLGASTVVGAPRS